MLLYETNTRIPKNKKKQPDGILVVPIGCLKD